MIKEGIAKTIPENLVEDYRAAGWDEVTTRAAIEQPVEKPKRGRRAAK